MYIIFPILFISVNFIFTYAAYSFIRMLPFFSGDYFCLSIMCILINIILYIINNNNIKNSIVSCTSLFLVSFILFFLFLIPFKDEIEKYTASNEYERILTTHELLINSSHTELQKKGIYYYYKNKDIEKLEEFSEQISEIIPISNKQLAQIIVNIRVLNNQTITNFFNICISDNVFTIDELNNLNELIVKEELKDKKI